MKLAIVGSLGKWFHLHDEVTARNIIHDAIDKFKPDVIVSGGADGIDTWAEQIAKDRGIKTEIYLPEQPRWHFYKKRNIKIAETCDVLIRIGHSKSHTRGSKFTLNYAKEHLNKETYEYIIE